MSKVKRIVSGLLASLMSASLFLTGCGSKTDGEAQNSNSQTTTTATASESASSSSQALEDVTLSWYFPMGAQPDQDKVFDAVNKKVKEKINATINFKPIDWGVWDDKMRVVFASGDPWDISFTCHWSPGADYKQNASKGLYAPIDDLMKQYAPTLSAYPSKYWDCLKVNGKIYGIFGMQLEVRQSGWWFRKDLVEKYNLKDIVMNAKHLKDLEPAFEVIKKNEPDMYIMDGSLEEYLTPDNKYLLNVAGDYFVDVDDPTLTLINRDKTYSLDTLKLKKSWYDKGYIKKDSIAVQDWGPITKAGKTFCGNQYTIKPGVEVEMSNQYNGNQFLVNAVTPAVVDPKGPLGNVHAISAKSPNKERAMMFLELMNTDKDIYNTMVYGIENEHYKKVDANTVEVVKDSKYTNGAWEFGNQFNAYLIKGQAADLYDQTKNLNETAKAHPFMSFNFNVDPVKNESAKLAAVWDQYDEAFKYGVTKDPDKTVKDYFSKKDASGWEKFNAEIEKQFSEWKAANSK